MFPSLPPALLGAYNVIQTPKTFSQAQGMWKRRIEEKELLGDLDNGNKVF